MEVFQAEDDFPSLLQGLSGTIIYLQGYLGPETGHAGHQTMANIGHADNDNETLCGESKGRQASPAFAFLLLSRKRWLVVY